MIDAARPIAETYAGRRVLVTGHTGFKGSWLSLWLSEMGAEVAGLSAALPSEPNAFERLSPVCARDIRADIRDLDALTRTMRDWVPEVVFHLAAQPIVRAGLADPLETFSVNIMGTAAVLEAARNVPGVRAVLVVTSDKVYDNHGDGRAFVEDDRLGGHEPYGVGKAAAELVAATYRSAGFHNGARSANRPHVATARAGNVIGGGDWAADRLIPDAVRAISAGRALTIRSPRATRPWQHVLEPVSGYLLHAHALLQAGDDAPAALNFGPDPADVRTVDDVVRRFLAAMQPHGTELVIDEDRTGAEAKALTVDSTLARSALAWCPVWGANDAVDRTAAWYRAWLSGERDLRAVSIAQLSEYVRGTANPALRLLA